MKIVAIATARNEADIIEAFVRHTAACCHQVIILDHGSTDETPDILGKLADEGLNLHVVTDPTLGSMQPLHMNRLMKLAINEHGADWVVSLDTDEFIQGDLAAALARAQAQGEPKCLKIRSRNYFVHPSNDPSVINPVQRLTHWDKNEAVRPVKPSGYKVMVPAGLARLEGAQIEKGNHRFGLDGFEAPFEIVSEIWLGHFSLRSPTQSAIRLAARTLQKHRKAGGRTDPSAHYDEPYRQLRESYSRFNEEFPKSRLTYGAPLPKDEEPIHNPIVYRGAPLQYTPADYGTDRFVKNILLLAEILARPIDPQSASSLGDQERPASIIAFFPQGAAGDKVPQKIHAQVGHFAFTFPIEAPDGDAPLCFGISSDRCIVEITEVTLVFAGTDVPARTFADEALHAMIEIADMGLMLPGIGGPRVLISRQPMTFHVHRWHREGEPFPVQIVVKLGLVHGTELMVSAITSATIVGNLHRASKEAGTLKGIKKELQKEAKQARKELENARSHPFKFLIRTWKAKLRGKRP